MSSIAAGSMIKQRSEWAFITLAFLEVSALSAFRFASLALAHKCLRKVKEAGMAHSAAAAAVF